jgi:hypothetical protein
MTVADAVPKTSISASETIRKVVLAAFLQKAIRLPIRHLISGASVLLEMAGSNHLNPVRFTGSNKG